VEVWKFRMAGWPFPARAGLTTARELSVKSAM
jgi:hypothetical protein